MEFIQITNSVSVASEMDSAGIDRVMVDLERRGKRERQRGRDTLLSDHQIEDVAAIRGVLRHAALQVRIDPWDGNSPKQVQTVVEAGADLVMLPMFRRAEEVQSFVDAVAGEARTCILLETASAVARIDSILDCTGVDEVYIGLNDLHREMHVTFMFELMAYGLVDLIVDRLRSAGLPFGIGGVAPQGTGPVGPRLILGEHQRLGSTACILSRGFLKRVDVSGGERPEVLGQEIALLRGIVQQWSMADEPEVQANHIEFRGVIDHVVEELHSGTRD